MGLMPIPGAPQPPAVDDVAHQIEVVRLVMLQEIEEEFRLAAARAEMNVADPDRTVVIDRRDRIHPKPCDW